MEDEKRKWMVLSVTSLGTLLVALNFSTLIIALPDLIRTLHASLLQAMWILLSYMVAQTVFVLMAGSLADLVGRKHLYQSGMVLFTIASLVAGFMDSATWLIVLRVFQGVGGALVLANSNAIVADTFPPQQMGRALGVNSMVVAFGQIIGPVLGGWLTTAFGWQWTFWFNVPFGVLAVTWGWFVMGRSGVTQPFKKRRMDSWGIGVYLCAIVGLLLALTWGPIQSWNTSVVWISAVVFLIALPTWLWIEGRHEQPLMHLHLFRNRTFAMGVFSNGVGSIGRLAVMFLLIFYFQGAKGDDALTAGILTIPLAVGLLVVSPISGWISDRIGATIPATAGLLIIMGSMVGFAVQTDLFTPYWILALWMTVFGVGTALFSSPNSSSVMNSVGKQYRGEASGIRSLTSNTGLLLSMAFSIVLVTSDIPRSAMLAIFAGTAVGMPGASTALDGFVSGLRLAFWILAGLMAVAAVLSAMRGVREALPKSDPNSVVFVDQE